MYCRGDEEEVVVADVVAAVVVVDDDAIDVTIATDGKRGLGLLDFDRPSVDSY